MNSFKKTYLALLKLLPVLILLVFATEGLAQEFLRIGGDVRQGKSKLAGATVVLMENGKEGKRIVTQDNGKFSFDLDYDNEFMVVISRGGLVTKRISFNTYDVPESERQFGHEYMGFQVELMRETEGMDFSILDKPIGKIYYEPAEGAFVHDRFYTKEIKKELEELEEEYEEKQEAVEDNYNGAISDADKTFKAGEYKTSKELYESALKYKPDEKYPQTQIEKIAKELAKRQQTDEEFGRLMTSAMDDFNKENYDKAIERFDAALLVKPKDPIATEKRVEAQAKQKAMADAEASQAAEQKKYDDAIAAGNQSFKAEKYDDALVSYKLASETKPEEQLPKDKMAEASKKIEEAAEQQEVNKRYDTLLADADKAFAAKDYKGAKSKYNEALGIKSKESRPTSQLKEIERIEKEAADNEQAFNDLIIKGDSDLEGKNYEEAISSYEKAVALKPADSSVKERLSNAKKLATEAQVANAAQEKLNADYQAAIDDGNQKMKAAEFEEAIKKYEVASKLKAEENYPKSQIEKAKVELAKKKEASAKEEEFARLLKQGDEAFDSKDWGKAKTNYKAALDLKSDAKRPKEQLEEIDKIEAEAQNVEEQFAILFKEGDASLTAKQFEEAIEKFEAAQELKPDDATTQTKLDAAKSGAKNLLAETEAAEKLEADYKAAIKLADGEMNKLQFAAAIEIYNKAINLKTEEEYPKAQIAKAQAELEKIRTAAETDKAYAGLIKDADDLFKSEALELAKEKYNEALGLKADEKYPEAQIIAIDKKIQELAAANAAELETKKKYDQLINEGNTAIENSDWTSGRDAFSDAKKLLPQEELPKQKLSEIDDKERKAIATANAEKEQAQIDGEYAELIKKADDSFDGKDYDAAKASYNKALGIKSDEKYPQERITKIESMLKAAAEAAEAEQLAAEKAKADAESAEAQAKLQAKYDAAVEKADKAFDAKQYTNARSGYEDALAIKSEENYPKEQIKKIEDELQAIEDATAAEKLAAESAEAQAELQAKYDAAVEKADKALDAKQYINARSGYEDALAIKSEENYPKEQIKKIEGELKAAEDAEVAKRLAAEAAGKAKADAELAAAKAEEQAQIDEQYNKLIASGDKTFASKNYLVAKKSYEKALEVKNNEQYPQDQIAQIDELLSKVAAEESAQAAQEEKYQVAMRLAQTEEGAGNTEGAIANYEIALESKPNSTIAAKKLEELKQELAAAKLEEEKRKSKEDAAKAKEAQYAGYIADADRYFAAKDWDKAIGNYQFASDLKPKEAYPRTQITKAQTAKNKQKIADTKRKAEEKAIAERQAKYQALIEEADGHFNAENWIEARITYNAAGRVFPSKSYPKDQIKKIDELEKAEAENADPGDAIIMDSLALNYPKGITEQTWKEGGKTITRRIVSNGRTGSDYRKVVHNWGGVYYFKNGESVSSYVWTKETE